MSVFYIYFVLYMCCNLLWINDKGKRGRYVTLCRWSTKQTVPLSVLAENQTKGFGLEISGDRKWVREREKRELDKRSSKRGLTKGDESDQSTPEQRDQSDEMRSRAVREDEKRNGLKRLTYRGAEGVTSHPLHFAVVAIEKGAFGSPSIKVDST